MSVAECVMAELATYTEAEVKADSQLVADLGMDSLDLLEASMAFEEEFEIIIPDEDLEKVATVADVVALVERIRGAAA